MKQVKVILTEGIREGRTQGRCAPDMTILGSLDNKSMKSFFHQAASFSGLCPLVALGIGIISTGGMRSLEPQYQKMGSMVVGIANCAIIVLGLLLGIVSLFGIPKHGAKGILGKALIGIMLNGLLIAVAVTLFLRARQLAGH